RPTTWEGQPDYWPAFERFQRMPRFHALAHSPALVQVLERLFGETVLVHPRNIGRIIFPDAAPTPPHQDFLHIRGTPDTWTAWLPLGDAPREVGGLALLPGSHTQGLLPSRAMPGAGGSGVDVPENAGWQTTDYRPGDAVLF